MIAEMTLVALRTAGHEMMLFAAFGFAIGGLSDFAVDLIWLVRGSWRSAYVYRRFDRLDLTTLPPGEKPGRIAIFVPAWDESTVIGDMLRHAVAALGDGDWRIYVGAYPNDPATIEAVRAVASPHVRLVIGTRDGPTTKADTLNNCWAAMHDDEVHRDVRIKAVVLHDAEDVVHPGEIRTYDRLIEKFDLVQLPVFPLPDAESRWIGGHYNDEFAENHGKTIIVREAIGAGVPSAGVGCAIARDMLARIADRRGGRPFDEDSLTEDYELGLRIAELGGRTVFVRLPESALQGPVAVRAHFPATLSTAVRQKSRWIAGIALSGWDRLGWHGGFAETWMRLQDRRAPLAALVLALGYLAILLTFVEAALRYTLIIPSHAAPAPVLSALLSLCVALALWRLVMRFWMVSRVYGPVEGLIAIPRTLISNIVAILAAWRAIGVYRKMRRDGVVRWDKTAHRFPSRIG